MCILDHTHKKRNSNTEKQWGNEPKEVRREISLRKNEENRKIREAQDEKKMKVM